jgi:hypothetical protein
VVGFGIAATPETGTHHGVYVLDDKGEVKDILQKASLTELKKAGAIRSVTHIIQPFPLLTQASH